MRMCSVRVGWLLYAAGLTAMVVLSELTRSFELFFAGHLAIGVGLLSHRLGARARMALTGPEPFRDVGPLLFVVAWPLTAPVALVVLSAVRLVPPRAGA